MTLQSRFHRKSGVPARASAFVLAGALALTSCNYGFSGGGGFPAEIRTMFIEPFENSTVQFELDQQLFQKLRDELPRALGVRPATQANADAVVTGKITRYEDAAQNYRADNRNVQVELHQVQITISVQLVNKRTNEVLWESSSLTGRGEYRPQDQTDVTGRELALKHIVQQIIDGAQSQW
jgi:curli biogenesis system outer membrane secretion channel CsgG